MSQTVSDYRWWRSKKMMQSMLKGDPHRWRAVKQSAKDLWSGLGK